MRPPDSRATATIREPETRTDHPLDDQSLWTPRSAGVSPRGRLVYTAAGSVVVLYAGLVVAATAIFLPNMQWFSYFVVGYEQGFVRRGLAGELLKLFPSDLYFTGLLILRWLVPTVFILSLAALAFTVATRFGRSERRIMLALLVPLLPFGVVKAVMMPTPDLLGGAALVMLALALASAGTDRTVVVSSTAYGLVNAMLALVHEAVPLLFSVGAIAAIVILAAKCPISVQRLSVLGAVIPGLVIVLAIGLFGQRDVSSQCARLPHRAVDHPVNLSLGQILSGQHAYRDYHDWVCRLISVQFSASPVDALKGGLHLGISPWVMSALVGVILFGATMLIIRLISGVPFGRIWRLLGRWRLWIVSAAMLLIPLFATSSDWVRWWVTVSFGLAVVYLLYAANQPESAQQSTPRGRVFFAVVMVLLALFPSGTIAQVGVLQHPDVQSLIQ